ncbi:integral membrane protein 2B isoform X2 [Parasteatoda tepidariorum]|uniref:Integral membrane protein 2 n=1 Tax=Parasteatoda tepidariorum TaxID=114398 RepID=A0A2L2XWS9_PARTP|nr:integral membrane protein 2B isoform X2 [Parasteatoda tepidariorum]
MTIAQQFLGKKTCKQQEEPLVPPFETPANIKDAEEGRPVVVTMHAHVRRVSSLTTLCIFATALLVLTTGVMGGMYLYRHFAHYKLRHFRGWCSVPYLPDVQPEPKPVSSELKQMASEALEVNSPKVNFFEEELDIDVKFEQYERIEVPSFERGRHAQFVHDFVANKTGIVDYENSRCFVMVLNRNYVFPPRVLYEQISKMRAGYFDADTQIVRHTMQVVTPPISDLKNVGLFIARDCAQMPIYMLEKANSLVFKRSLDSSSKDLFVEFAGNKVNEFQIINLHDAIAGDNVVANS